MLAFFINRDLSLSLSLSLITRKEGSCETLILTLYTLQLAPTHFLALGLSFLPYFSPSAPSPPPAPSFSFSFASLSAA